MEQTREQWLTRFVENIRPTFSEAGFPLPERIRVTCGFPSKMARSDKRRAIGEHWPPAASEDATHEISVSQTVSDPIQVAAILVHELGHAATDGDGHKGRFPQCMNAMLLEGKPTSTVAGEPFKTAFGRMIASLGKYPHAKLNVGGGKKTQTTRMMKAVCPQCEYTVRLSQKWAAVGLPVCPCCDETFELQ
jgi:hypothetical protein